MNTSVSSSASPSGEISPFRKRSREAASRFLQTVVVIDDQARFDLTPRKETAKQAIEQTRELEAEEAATHASVSSDVDDVLPDDLGALSPPDEEQIQTAVEHELNAQRLIERFAGEGLVCAVLKPDKDNIPTILGDTAKAAHRSDVIIVDWQILEEPQDQGKHALELIRNVLQDDLKSSGRMRLIIVYTGETDVNQIAKDIHDAIESSALATLVLDNGKPVVSGDSIRIVVLAKESSKAIPQAKVSINDLPSRILDEFAEMTGGLVTNATLVALSVVREKTPTILKKLHKGLDAPFMTHRSLIPQPDDAGELLVSIIADELHSVMDQHGVSRHLDLGVIKDWIADNHPQGEFLILDAGGQPVPLLESSLQKMLEMGKKTAFENGGVPGLTSGSAHQKLTYAFCRPNDRLNAERHDEDFAMLTTLQTRYGSTSPAPILSMGVILSKTESQEQGERTTYWLCIQPPCDSVRLKGDAVKFPLLPMSEATDKDFHLIVPTAIPSKRVRLRLTDKLAESDNVKFKPENGCVRSQSKDGHFVFDSLQGPYQWVAQVKFARAQATMNDLSAELSRVGTDLSEWLRSFKPKKSI